MMSVLPSPGEKPRFVSNMFGRIAERYDLMNTLMSMGLDEGWRRAVVQEARTPLRGEVLDVGTGTAKLAAAFARLRFPSRVVGVDFAVPMLRAGIPLAKANGLDLAAADGQQLPFLDGRFDTVVSGFVVRNLGDVAVGIREQIRVLKPGGRIVTLEITPGPPGILRPFFRLYFRGIVPLLGKLIAGDSTAYTYLPESAAAFLEPERLADLLRESGMTDVKTQRLGIGSVAITSGTKQ